MAVAHTLGKSLKEIGEMSPDELALWIAWLNEYGPTAERRAELKIQNWNVAMIVSTIINCRFGWAGDSRPEDLIPDDEQSEPNAEQMEAALKAWCVNQGGKVAQGVK